MNKSLIKLILKIILLILIIWSIFAILIHNFGMYFFDGEYASYKETVDYIRNTTAYNKVIIWGDSVAKSAVIPSLISPETYNLSMPGISPIEQYFMMEEYLEKHEKPKTIIMMYSMAGYNQNVIDQFFWKRTVYFDCLKTSEFLEIIKTGLFPDTFNSILTFLQYKTYMPNKYFAAVKNSITQSRHGTNIILYQDNRQNQGHQYFGTEEEYKPNNVSIDQKNDFKPLPIMEYYLFKCIELCQENDIQVIILENPINLSTYNNSQAGFREEYIEYMENLGKKYEGIIVDPNITVVDDSWLGDYVHLNPNGATQFTLLLRDAYSEYLY